MEYDINIIIAYLDILTADDTFKDDRNAFNACGLSSEDMKDVKTFLQEQHQEIKALSEMSGYNWYAHYIKKDKATLGENNKVAKTPRVTVKYSPTQQAWKVFIKPSGVRELGMTIAQGGSKHVVTNGVELSLVDNKLTLEKVVMMRAKTFEKENDIFNQVKEDRTVDIVKYVTSSQETKQIYTVRKGLYYYTNTYGGQESTVLIDPKNMIEKSQDTIFQGLSDFVMQVGSQINDMHNKGSTHSDLKLENVLVSSVNRDGTSNTKFAVIDPDEKKRDPKILGTDMYPKFRTAGLTVISTFSDKTNTELNNLGINTENLPPLTMYNRSENGRIVCGHMDDSYGFMVSMLRQIQLLDKKRKPLCIRFIETQLRVLFEHCNTCQDSNDNEWNGPTVSSIKEAFGKFCKENNYKKVYDNSLRTSKVIQTLPNVVNFSFGKIIKRRITISATLAYFTGDILNFIFKDTYHAKITFDKLLSALSTGNISSLQNVDLTTVLSTAKASGWIDNNEKEILTRVVTQLTQGKNLNNASWSDSPSQVDPLDNGKEGPKGPSI